MGPHEGCGSRSCGEDAGLEQQLRGQGHCGDGHQLRALGRPTLVSARAGLGQPEQKPEEYPSNRTGNR